MCFLRITNAILCIHAALVVNVVSKCQHTERNYRELQELHRELFTVLTFPCNQFGELEPGLN